MAKAFPAEFHADVVAVARKREAPISQIAKDFGISEATLHNWLKRGRRRRGCPRRLTDADRPKSCVSPRSASASWSRRTTSCAGPPSIWDVAAQPKMMYPLVSDLADEGIPVALTCRVLGFSKQGYFKWRAKPVCDRDLSDAYLINAAFDAHHDDPTFGYRFISDELEALGLVASENRVQRLCSLAAHLVGAFEEAGPQPPAGPSGPRRPGPAQLHGRHDQRPCG